MEKIYNKFRKVLFFGICPVILLLLFAVQESRGADIYVDDDTCPGMGEGTFVLPFCSIQDAIDSAYVDDDVLVNPGDYVPPIVMRTGVDVRDADGSDAFKPRIVGTVERKTLVKFLEGVQDATLDGFLLDDAASIEDHAMMFMVGYNTKVANDGTHSKNLTVRNCDFLAADTPTGSHARAGISMHATLQNVLIANNTFRNIYGTAIVVGKHAPSPYPLKYSSVTIEDNTIENNAWGGIYLRSMPDMWNKLYIRNNTITSNMHETVPRGPLGHVGILLINIHRGYSKTDGTPREDAPTIPYCNELNDNICGAVIEGNSVSNHNLAGILLEKTWSIPPHVTGNHVFENSLTGINILDSTQATISNNEINNNFRSGIAFNSHYRDHAGPLSRAVKIEGNDIHHNSFSGIATIDYLTGPLTITGNTIHNNTKAGIAFFNAADQVTIEDNEIYENDAAGIYTGKWVGEAATENRPGPDVKFDRTNGPVHLTIRRNKVYNNFAGMRIDHASGSISNNLVYDNTQAGIRFSGKNVGAYEPFGQSWGITSVENNTVSDNGLAGIVYDNINYLPGSNGRPDDGSDKDDDGLRDFVDTPRMFRMDGIATLPISMTNNIVTWNLDLGLRDSTCYTLVRDYNLLHYNNWDDVKFNDEHFQLGSCLHNEHEIGKWYGDEDYEVADSEPLFVDRAGRDYHLQATSPALGTGQSEEDMGAYGGSDPMTW